MASNQTLIVGAGLAGITCAEQLARRRERVVLVDRRAHIGGNAMDWHDDAGVLIHPYGPHIFHTNSQRVFEYLSQFTSWRFYEHRVLANVGGELYPLPINRTTINAVYDTCLSTPDEVEQFLAHERVELPEPLRTSEDVALSTVGPMLTDMFFRGYTKKQWGVGLEGLSSSVIRRLPVRTDTDDRYFTDRFQFMPAEGYGVMFAHMLESPWIEVRLGADGMKLLEQEHWKHTVWTGPIDEYFGHCFGRLPYRSLRFEHRHSPDEGLLQPVATVNYPSENVPYTRVSEFRHITGQLHEGTSLCYEYPQAEGDPYYPVPNEDNQALYRRYEEMTRSLKVSFVGRLATYKYYNLDQVCAAALKTVADLGL